MNKLFFLLLPLSLLIASCGTDEEPIAKTGDLAITFAPKFMGQDFFVNKEYTFPDGMKVRFERFDFLVSDAATSESKSTHKVDLAEVEFINLTSNASNPLASSEFSWTSVNMVPQEYEGLNFNLGLSDEWNAKTPQDSDLGSNNPLKITSLYWQNWESYIFMRLEGFADLNRDGEIGSDESFIYHTGQTGQEESINLNGEFSIVANQVKSVEVDINVEDILYDETGVQRFNMDEIRTAHGNPSSTETISILMDGAASAFEMKQ